MMARKNKKQTSPDSRERILQAAVMLFARQGYGNTGLRELAGAADVNLAMINYFFGSKKALLKEILDIFFSGYLEVARRELAGDEARSVKLNRFIHGAVAYFSAHRDYLLVTITELPHDDPEITGHKAGWGRQLVETVEKYLEFGVPDSGKENTIVPVIFCSMLTSMMASRFLFSPVMAQVQPKELEATSMEEYADIISKIFLQGVGDILCTKG
jgi:AcrR family transcriptional regulator